MPLHKVPLCTMKYVGDVNSSGTFKYDTTVNLNKTTNKILHDKSIKIINKISNLKYFYSNEKNIGKMNLNKNMYKIFLNPIKFKSIKQLYRKTNINIAKIDIKILELLKLNSCFKFSMTKSLFRFYHQNLFKNDNKIFLLKNNKFGLSKLSNKKYINFIRNLDLNILNSKKIEFANKINIICKLNAKTIEVLKLRECCKSLRRFVIINKIKHCSKSDSSNFLDEIKNKELSKSYYYNLDILNLRDLHKYNKAKNLTVLRFNYMFKLFNKKLDTQRILYINKFNAMFFYKENVKKINLSLAKYFDKKVENLIAKNISNIVFSYLFNREIFILQNKYLKINRINLSLFKNNNLFLNNFNLKNISFYKQKYLKNNSIKLLYKNSSLFVNSLNFYLMSKLYFQKYLGNISIKSIDLFKNNKFLKLDSCENIYLNKNKLLNKLINTGLFKVNYKYYSLRNIRNINKYTSNYLSLYDDKKIFKLDFMFLNHVDLHRLSKSKFKTMKAYKLHNIFFNSSYYLCIADNKKMSIENIEEYLDKDALYSVYKNKTVYMYKDTVIPLFNVMNKLNKFLYKASIFNIKLSHEKYLKTVYFKKMFIKYEKHLDNLTLLSLFKLRNLHLKDMSIVDIYKNKLRYLLDISIVDINKEYIKMLNTTIEKNINLINRNKFLKLIKRWWWLNATGPYDPIIVPNKDYLYNFDLLNNLKYEYLRFNTHPIEWGNNWGIDYDIPPVAVSIEIMLDMINIIGMVSQHNVQGWLCVTGKEGIQLLMELIYDWYNMDSSKPNKDYYRIYRWIRWEAEKVYFLDCETGLQAIGILLANLIDYMKFHHFNVVPLWRNLKAMDIERTFNKKASNNDLIKDLDKLKGKRHYFIETKNTNKKNIFGGLKNG
ncbi:hypothetical protein FDJ70_07530 [Clostridium botulinum]|uniref:hypothetical protein n=1 Tax=Clostridium botulinum TaxID=1491 RepID=UPI0013F6FAB7|nr:hypothetical protein [Clostridium botulinum]MCD3217496.1 hypothetical protein [Clostridium botulinum C]NFV47523.1 hypothetical protein [Clostridium botulinum]